jgi:B-box zinc finger
LDSNTATLSISSDEGKKRCQEHGKTLRLWCIQDKEMVCKKCPLNGTHKDHRIVPLDEKNLSTLTALEQSINNSKEMMDKLSAKFGMFQSINSMLKSEYNQVAEQVNRNV